MIAKLTCWVWMALSIPLLLQANAPQVTTIPPGVPLLEQVDWRRDFYAYDLGPRRQGLRPSCAVFAVVAALEFTASQKAKEPVSLSEEFLLWALMEKATDGIAEQNVAEGKDAGFSLPAVLEALQRRGIAKAEFMPNLVSGRLSAIDTPSLQALQDAAQRRNLSAEWITNQREISTGQIVQHLNQGHPVVVALKWPHENTMRHSPVLSQQQPRSDYVHAVTLVGYTTVDRDPRKIRFLFINSWGPRWGIGGYGWIYRDYLEENLLVALVVTPQW